MAFTKLSNPGILYDDGRKITGKRFHFLEEKVNFSSIRSLHGTRESILSESEMDPTRKRRFDLWYATRTRRPQTRLQRTNNSDLFLKNGLGAFISENIIRKVFFSQNTMVV